MPCDLTTRSTCSRSHRERPVRSCPWPTSYQPPAHTADPTSKGAPLCLSHQYHLDGDQARLVRHAVRCNHVPLPIVSSALLHLVRALIGQTSIVCFAGPVVRGARPHIAMPIERAVLVCGMGSNLRYGNRQTNPGSSGSGRNAANEFQAICGLHAYAHYAPR